jgi:YHS domain-containing protein
MNRLRLGSMAVALLLTANVFAKTDPVYTGFFSSLAVGGYDVVAYFTESKPVEGNSKFSFEYMNAEWRFSNAENLMLFKAEPEKFVPRYGGYCAWAVSQGYTARGNPENWRIEDGKLYLNYDDEVQATWVKDIPGYIGLADKNWPAILAE